MNLLSYFLNLVSYSEKIVRVPSLFRGILIETILSLNGCKMDVFLKKWHFVLAKIKKTGRATI